MIVEILCIGEELLSGKTINSNSAYLSEKMENIGHEVLYHSVVGDNPKRIFECLDIALERADIILITGGLGPTDDDLTIETLAEYLGLTLIFHQSILDKIELIYKNTGRTATEMCKKQALIPQNATIISNNIGTAAGVLLEFKENKRLNKKYNSTKIIAAYPGVPYEMKDMWETQSEQFFKNKATNITIVKDLKFIGIPEAKLAEKVKDILQQENPTVAPYVSAGEVTLRIKSKAIYESEAQLLLNQTEEKILNKANEFYYGFNDNSLEEIIGNLLSKNNLTLSIAESCTGGLLSSKLTDVSGSSKYIFLNLVSYSNEAKKQMLGVKNETLEKYGAVSKETVTEMAQGIRKLANTDIGVAISGIAGPTGGTENKQVGLIYLAIEINNKIETYEIKISNKFNRIQIKERAAKQALNFLRKSILNYLG
ncbi:MAG: competence/damage-inducible protein A [bacterium]